MRIHFYLSRTLSCTNIFILLFLDCHFLQSVNPILRLRIRSFKENWVSEHTIQLLMVMRNIDRQRGEERNKTSRKKECPVIRQRHGHACQNRATALQCCAKVHVSASTHGRHGSMRWQAQNYINKRVRAREALLSHRLCVMLPAGLEEEPCNGPITYANWQMETIGLSPLSLFFSVLFLEAIDPCHQLKQL